MGVESHYKQKVEQLQGPRLTSDLILLAGRLFDAATQDVPSDMVIPPPTHFSDNSEETRVYWRFGNEDQDHEFFQVHLIGRSLSFALQHRHTAEPSGPDGQDGFVTSGSTFVDHQKTILVVGSQRPAIFSHDGMRDRGRKDALRGIEADRPIFKKDGREIILPAFRKRLDHTMAVIGIHESVPDIHQSLPELQELLLAS